MKDHSQNGEQRIIEKYFSDRVGVLLDVGANDGSTLSNSRGLMLSQWAGVLIEPSPAAFQKLCTLYGAPEAGNLSQVKIKDATLIRAAITDKNGPLDFYDSGTHLKKGDVALLSTTVPGELERWKKSGEQFTKTSVRGITFEDLMKQSGQSIFEMISIDAEGCDVAILKQIDLTAVGCDLVCVEYNNSPQAEAEIRAHCSFHGMKLLHRNFENLIFSR